MKYINTAKVQKLIAISREKRFVSPNEIINLSTIDINMLGANAQFVIPFSKTAEETPKDPKAAKKVVKKVTKVKATSKKVDKKKESVVKKVIKSVVKKASKSKKSKKKKS